MLRCLTGHILHVPLDRSHETDDSLNRLQLKKVPDYHGSSFNPEQLNNSDIKPSADNAKNHEKAAETWSKVEKASPPSSAHTIEFQPFLVFCATAGHRAAPYQFGV